GLQGRRRHQTVECFGVYLFLEIEARAEANLLDRESRMHEREFVLQRNGELLAVAQRLAGKVGEQQAHLSRVTWIDGGERADRVEAVEKKMGIHLRFEC